MCWLARECVRFPETVKHIEVLSSGASDHQMPKLSTLGTDELVLYVLCTRIHALGFQRFLI